MESRTTNIVSKCSHLHFKNDSNNTKRKEAAIKPLRNSFFAKALHKETQSEALWKAKRTQLESGCLQISNVTTKTSSETATRKYLGKGMSESSCRHMPFFLTQTVVTVISGMPTYYSNSSEAIHSMLWNNPVFFSRFDSFSKGILECPLEKKMDVIYEQMGTHLTQKLIFSRKKKKNWAIIIMDFKPMTNIYDDNSQELNHLLLIYKKRYH